MALFLSFSVAPRPLAGRGVGVRGLLRSPDSPPLPQQPQRLFQIQPSVIDGAAGDDADDAAALPARLWQGVEERFDIRDRRDAARGDDGNGERAARSAVAVTLTPCSNPSRSISV